MSITFLIEKDVLFTFDWGRFVLTYINNDGRLDKKRNVGVVYVSLHLSCERYTAMIFNDSDRRKYNIITHLICNPHGIYTFSLDTNHRAIPYPLGPPVKRRHLFVKPQVTSPKKEAEWQQQQKSHKLLNSFNNSITAQLRPLS